MDSRRDSSGDVGVGRFAVAFATYTVGDRLAGLRFCVQILGYVGVELRDALPGFS
jgi:hypothetical protein